jgi:cyanate permease
MGVVMGTASFSGLAPLLAGWLRDTTGSYETAFLLLIPLVIPAFIAFIKLTPVEEGAKVG